ncbi:hypothetical protein [Ohessyouella blattaphilus]|uniref:hypothetical protein n=1 Tax=Ohessyouella blattaphilus TaxID=2949333 RepID=UPI0021C914AF|nr:hypothetical protein [Ohessyouella blattaphilus]
MEGISRKGKMTQLEIVVQVLESFGGKESYSKIYKEYESIGGVILSQGGKAGIRKTIEDHSSDSMNYKGKRYSICKLQTSNLVPVR